MSGKIVLFGPYPPPFGGVAIFVKRLHEALTKSGSDCDLLIFREDASNQYVQPTLVSTFSHFSKLSRNDVFADSCSFFLEYPSIGAVVSWLFLKATRKYKWIKIIHDGTLPDRYKKFDLLTKFLFKLSIMFIDEFIVVHNDLKQWLTDYVSVPQQISFIPSLLPLPTGAIKAELPKEILEFFPVNKKIVCSIGAFTSNYGFKKVADAVDAIRKYAGLDLALVLIDGAFTKDDQYRKDVINDRQWITVFEKLPHHYVLAILRKSNVFVRSVAVESYGLSRVEAILSGTPVVATPVGETRGMLLFNFEDQLALERQLKEALFNVSIKKNVSIWAEQFKREAEHNLSAIVDVLTNKKHANV